MLTSIIIAIYFFVSAYLMFKYLKWVFCDSAWKTRINKQAHVSSYLLNNSSKHVFLLLDFNFSISVAAGFILVHNYCLVVSFITLTLT